ncbi:GNAT family N-acetyltransferase [Streptomyces sp. NPDC047046]|uniref:GNAT family N-acetyltransferase n=1 Tax=Streptomyces sp. NPDC047046 TaxID=3155378 RepID=UPI0033DA6238
MDGVLRSARELWAELAGIPGEFPSTPGGVRVAVAPDSRLCPSGWVGVVTLGGASLVTVPDEAAAEPLRGTRALTEAALRERLPVGAVLGPAALSYVSGDAFRPVAPGGPQVEQLPSGLVDLAELERAAGEEDAGEADLGGITSPVFVVHEHGRPVAASGYAHWPHRTAHLCVLTAPGTRGRGLARTTASAATAHALAAGLLPQWRARPPASRRVAATLGYLELGTQLSLRLG